MKIITSTDNPIYKSLKELRTARGRREQGLFLAEGPHLAEEALKSGAVIRYVAVRDGDVQKYEALLQAANKAGAEALVLSTKQFNILADSETPQGILTGVSIRTVDIKELDIKHDGISVVLERVQDPGNVGTILRTALAVNAAFAVLTADCADPWSQKVVRSSQGAVFHLPIIVADSAAEAIAWLNECGWHTACGHLNGSDFFSRTAHSRTALVIGNEAAGVSAEAAGACSVLYKLPMPGRAESLNAAVAAGVMLYDLWRENNS